MGHDCAPKRIVPPKSEASSRFSVLPEASFHSAIKPTIRCGVCGLNSVLLASFKPATLRANSITANCIPRQIPK